MFRPIAALLLVVAVACGSRTRSAVAPATVTTVDGQVLGVDGIPPERALAQNLRVTVRSGPEPVVVELAPGWYLERKGLRLERNQSIAVDGTVDRERNLFIARRVRANSVSVELRDAEGRQLWPGGAADAGVTPVPSAAP